MATDIINKKGSVTIDETNTIADYSTGDNRGRVMLTDVEATGDILITPTDYGAIDEAFEFAGNAFESANEFVAEFAETAFDNTSEILERLAAGQNDAMEKTLAIAADVTRSDADAAQRRMLQFAGLAAGALVLTVVAWRFIK